jgi:PAS domain S-box-containing protein
MKSPLQILFLEDKSRDAELVQETLAAEGIPSEIARVENEPEFVAALERGGFDLILADYTLPSFDGISAVKIAQRKSPQTPFIFVSGAMDEEAAIEALKFGATDYVFKTRLLGIVPSVQRALREREERNWLIQAEAALRRSEAYLAEAQKLSHTGSFGWDVSTGEIYWSRETFRIFDYLPQGKATIDMVFDRTHPEDQPMVQEVVDRATRELQSFDFEHRLLLPDGTVKHVRVVGHPARGESGRAEFVGAVTDISERKRAELLLRESEQKFRAIFNEAGTGIAVVDIVAGGPVENNHALQSMLGRTREELNRLEIFDELTAAEDREADAIRFRELCEGRRDAFRQEKHLVRRDGQSVWANVIFTLLRDTDGRPRHVVAIHEDITERKRSEENLRNAFNEIQKLRDLLYKENIALREEVDKASMFEEIVGGSPPLQAVLTRVAKVAPTDSTVLITGETGTGKELFARAIHKRSARASRAFVTVNCAATPASLIASELFGHEKGAFTGALQRHLGRFELAEGGTLFLDEVGELPAETQIALLRVLQEREFDRVGGIHPIPADVRVIVATNRDLKAAIANGTFRNDLFYRLNVFPIEIPPLRERQEDIPTLIVYFVDRYSRKLGKKIRTIEKKTLDLMKTYSWPGNIRELQNVIERSVIVCESDALAVDPSWISAESAAASPLQPAAARMSTAQEREAIERALALTEGRVSGPSGAAVQLGVPASTLESRIRSLKINKFRFKRV